MAWTGFTDDQLQRLKSGSEEDTHSSTSPLRKHAESHDPRIRPQNARPRPQRGRGPPSSNRPGESEPTQLHQNQMLSKPRQAQHQQRTPNLGAIRIKAAGPGASSSIRKQEQTEPSPTKPPDEEAAVKKGTQLGQDSIGAPKKPTVEGVADKHKVPLGKELDEKEGLSRELSKMEEFQQQQKEIEDDNHRKKNLLAFAIADRKKKTQAEVKRLAFIQKELSRIEEFLTTDVNILRDKIEEASRRYAEAQKRYKKAEEEFVAAKIHLHKACEHKEALTEHLCTIIRMNELHKSKKLEELVEKLNVNNLASFEAEMEAEAAKKAERQRHLSSTLAGEASKDPKRTSSVSSTGEASPAETVLQEPDPPTTLNPKADDSSCAAIQCPNSSSSPSTNTTLGTEATHPPPGSGQGQSSGSSSTGDGAIMQGDIVLLESTSNGLLRGEDTGRMETASGMSSSLSKESSHELASKDSKVNEAEKTSVV